jgi:hypothetical protein
VGAVVSVLLTNASLTVRRVTDNAARNAHGERTGPVYGMVEGFYPGRVSERPDGGWGLGVDPRLWPVRRDDLVIGDDGRSWLVRSADLITNNYDSRVDWVRVDALHRGNGGTEPGGAWFVARYTDHVEPVPPDGPPTSPQPGLWTGNGPPTSVDFGANEGDEYIDLLSGTVYRLNP